MSNNYYDATGVLVLDRITPVITALFGGFNLDATYPGDGETYIARISEGNDPQWDDIRDNLVELAYQLGRPFPEDEEPSIQSYLRLLAKHFSAEGDPQLEHLLKAHRFEGDAELETLFIVARCLDDGHGLRAIRFEGCWHSDRPRLFEFGGDGMFISRERHRLQQLDPRPGTRAGPAQGDSGRQSRRGGRPDRTRNRQPARRYRR